MTDLIAGSWFVMVLAILAAAFTRPEIAAVLCLAPLWLWFVRGRPPT